MKAKIAMEEMSLSVGSIILNHEDNWQKSYLLSLRNNVLLCQKQKQQSYQDQDTNDIIDYKSSIYIYTVAPQFCKTNVPPKSKIQSDAHVHSSVDFLYKCKFKFQPNRP